jgi:hypothetical protein
VSDFDRTETGAFLSECARRGAVGVDVHLVGATGTAVARLRLDPYPAPAAREGSPSFPEAHPVDAAELAHALLAASVEPAEQ